MFAPDEVLTAFHASLQGGQGRRVYIDGRRHDRPFVVPSRPPGDLSELLNAVCEQSPGREVAVVVNDLQVHSPSLLASARRFISGLLACTGPPAGRLGLDVFAGDYRRLPFGVHRDPAENFLFGVHGVRRIHLWPGEALSERIGPNDYQERLADAQTYDIGPGDLLYWPESTWHVGECPQGPSMTLTISWWTGRGALDDVGQAALNAWRRALRLGEDTDDAISYPDAASATPPPAMINALERLPSFDVQGAEVTAEIKARWAARRSGLGFSPLPPPADVDAAPQRLTKAAVGPLVAYREGDDLLVSVNGYVGRFAQARLETVQRLEAGGTLDRSEVDPELALALARWRALA